MSSLRIAQEAAIRIAVIHRVAGRHGATIELGTIAGLGVAALAVADGKLAATLTRGGTLPASVRVTAIPLDPLGREGPPLFVQASLACSVSP